MPSARPAPAAGGRARSKRPEESRRAGGGRRSFLQERLERGPEVRGGPAHGVDVCAQPDAVLEAQAVELVELLLGEREGGGARRRERAQHFTDLLLEVGVFVHARHETQLRGFGCRQDPAGRREIERDLFSDGALEEGHDDGGHEAALHFRIAEPRSATTRTSASRSARSMAPSRAAIMGVSIAFFFSGRLSVTVSTPPCTASSTRSLSLTAPPRFRFPGAATRSTTLCPGHRS